MLSIKIQIRLTGNIQIQQKVIETTIYWRQMIMSKKLTLQQELHRELKNLEFKKEFNELEEEFEVIQAMIDARNKQNLTQKELSKLSNIDQANISKIERGIYNPSINVLRRLADAMNMDLKIEFVPRDK